jgi:hypothetical protein
LLDKDNERCPEKLIQTVKQTQPVGHVEFKLPAQGQEPARPVKQALYVSHLRLSPPDRKRKTSAYQTVEAYAVIASEVDTPTGHIPLEWVLLTNMPITHVLQAKTLLQWYLCRWQIEIYFRILKSGCQVEKLQPSTKERFDPCLTLYMIVAWRLLYITQLARCQPEADCALVFTQEEWQVAYLLLYQKPLPDKPPTLQHLVQIIAQLGGYLYRKHDSPPGPTALWQGIQKLNQSVMAYRAFNKVCHKTYG